MSVLLQLVVSTFILWKTQRTIECNNMVFCFLINKLHKNLAGNEESVFVREEDDFAAIFLKTAIINLADDNEDGKVSLGEVREKSIEYLIDIFKFLDVDNNNFLVENETTIQHVKINEVESIMKEIYKIFDQNKDDQVSTEDLPNKETFDLNSDGDVTLNELIRKASNGKAPDIIFLPRPFQTLIKNLDTSKDEKISYDEFEKFMKEVFNVLDEDDDLDLNMDEVLDVLGGNKVEINYFLKPYKTVSKQVLMNLITSADLNGDDKINLDEIIRFTDFEFLTNSVAMLHNLEDSDLHRSSRSRFENILRIEDNVSLWLTLADRLLQRMEASN